MSGHSLKIATSEYMISDVNGIGMRLGWFPRVVAEAFLEATKDGEIKRSPDPVTTISGDLSWFNNSPDDAVLTVLVHRAPRSIVAQSPATVIIMDAWTFAVGANPQADYPSVNQDNTGGKLQLDRSSVAAADLAYGRFFLDSDASQVWVPIGTVPSMQTMHFRYLAAVQTPGVWTSPSEFEPRWEAETRWTRLIAFSVPVGSA